VKKKEKEKDTPGFEEEGLDREETEAAGEETRTAGEENASAGQEGQDSPSGKADNAAAETEKELAEMKDRYLRLLAEYDNYRKRTAREKESFYTMAKADAVERFLPIYDNIERAVKNPTQDEAFMKGIEMILQQIKDVFKLLGVEEIEAAGVKFDPEKHNAVMHIEDDSLEENAVAEVFQRGFEIDGKVIRHAVVKVAN
jgi:molecular chaperone GrpE